MLQMSRSAIHGSDNAECINLASRYRVGRFSGIKLGKRANAERGMDVVIAGANPSAYSKRATPVKSCTCLVRRARPVRQPVLPDLIRKLRTGGIPPVGVRTARNRKFAERQGNLL